MNEVELKKIWWHSRRGMLELDLLLVPFTNGKLGSLEDETIRIYQRLLEQEDQDLFSWLIGKEVAPDPELKLMVKIILENNSR
tara:strand:- start:431 stop:679 length:249 start_codon:yes stop_codon:yes gene_type:complete